MSEKKDTKFKPGQSGNPQGRKPGSGELGKLRKQIADALPEIVTALLEKAKEGDIGAARLLLERAIPPLKAEEMVAPVELPEGGLADQGRAVVNAAAIGSLAPGQAAQLLQGLGSLAKLVETDDLAKRVTALEEKNAVH